jgi:TRAP-type uncharacterized transport system fused permease subunit
MTPEPTATQSSTNKMWIFLIVLAVLALGLDLFAYIRKPVPWPEALRVPFLLVGILLMACHGLLPATKPGARRAVHALSIVCIAIAMVFVFFDMFQL